MTTKKNPLHHSPYAFIPYLPSTSHPPPSFKVTNASTWTYSGPVLDPANLPPSLETWCTASTAPSSALLTALLPLLSFLQDHLAAAGVTHYWLTLRATSPTRAFDVPRWHADDDFFAGLRPEQRSGSKKKREKGESWKACTTLLGAPTLFIHRSDNAAALRTLRRLQAAEARTREHACCAIRCEACFDTGEAVREGLAAALAETKVVQARYGELALFRVGDADGAVHSEPPCGTDRVFVNVVPGTEDELRRLMKRYGMGFPRAWSLGVPGGAVADELL